MHEIHSIEKETSKTIYLVPGRRPTIFQATTRQDKVWPEVWTKIGKSAQKRENQYGRMRSQNSTTLVDWQASILSIRRTLSTKSPSKSQREVLEVPVDAAMLCKKRARHTSGLQETVARLTAPSKVPKKCAWKVESHEFTRQRVEPSLPKLNEDHNAGKRSNSMVIAIWYKHLFPCRRLWRSRMRRNQWIRLETVSAWQLNKVKSKNELI